MATATRTAPNELARPPVQSSQEPKQQQQQQKLPRKLSLLPSLRDGYGDGPAPMCAKTLNLTVVILGASGDLAKKKTYPALFALYTKGFLPERLQLVGYARSGLSDQELRDRLKEHLKGEQDKVDAFLKLCVYQKGEYSGDNGYQELQKRISNWEQQGLSKGCNQALLGRLFYMALPPSVYPEAAEGLRKNVVKFGSTAASNSWYRVVLEKPFGMDLESSEDLADKIGALWPEENLFRIDHYLGKELVQNMLVLRFANTLFSAWWSRHYVSNVQVTFKEPFGTEGRGGYFDQYGIIRDVIQNHLIQVLALLAMEPPVSMHPDDIRDEKVKLLRCVVPAKAEECVLGQYVAANGQQGYQDDPTVPDGSKTATFAAIRLNIKNDRWAGVPFIIKAGKALNERAALVRIQLKTPAAPLFGNLHHMRNELVIKFQPGEAIYAKMVMKKPGLEMDEIMSELDLTYSERHHDVVIPDAYERLILDCIRGDQQHFVRRDELRAAWAIFTPLLHAIDQGKVPAPQPYMAGSRGPPAADQLMADAGYVKTQYEWTDHKSHSGSASNASTPKAGAAAGNGNGNGNGGPKAAL